MFSRKCSPSLSRGGARALCALTQLEEEQSSLATWALKSARLPRSLASSDLSQPLPMLKSSSCPLLHRGAPWLLRLRAVVTLGHCSAGTQQHRWSLCHGSRAEVQPPAGAVG